MCSLTAAQGITGIVLHRAHELCTHLTPENSAPSCTRFPLSCVPEQSCELVLQRRLCAARCVKKAHTSHTPLTHANTSYVFTLVPYTQAREQHRVTTSQQDPLDNVAYPTNMLQVCRVAYFKACKGRACVARSKCGHGMCARASVGTCVCVWASLPRLW